MAGRAEGEALKMEPEFATKHLRCRSIMRPLEAKKSAPRIGLVTVAIQKRCSTSWPGEKDTLRSLFPKVLMEVPLAAMRLVVSDWS